MKLGLRFILLTLCCCLLLAVAGAQAPGDPQREQREKDAEALFLQGEARMKVASYEEAINAFENLLKRYPDTDARFKAQFRMADALIGLKSEAKAYELLQSVVKEENPDWSPKALLKIGDAYTAQQKYSDAFRAYKLIISDFPDSPMVDHAHFAIGKTHFQLGHYELAAAELDKVGTATASLMPDLQRVSPGEPLYIRLTEPNLVANADSSLTVKVVAKSGDTETVTLRPEIEGGDRFTAALPTALGNAKAGDGTLQLFGNDTVEVYYKTRYVGSDAREQRIPIATASNARIILRDSLGNEVRGVVLSDTLVVEILDADRDVTDKPDTIVAEVKTKKKDSEKVTLTETGAHTGIFRTELKTIAGDPKPDSGTIESNADLAEGSATQLDDTITANYSDENNLSSKDGGPRKVSEAITIYVATGGKVAGVDHTYEDPSMAIKAMLYKGRSLSQIATTYKDLGQADSARQSFKKASEQFQMVIAQYPNAPEVEDALYGMYQNYVAQDNYNSAISIITQITTRFPQSSRAPEALMELANLHVLREEYDRALAIFQNLAQSAKGTPLAEEAQYRICVTYLEMLKPKLGSLTAIKGGGPSVTPEQVTVSLEEFARAYPNSERTPDAMWQLVDFRFKNEDYRGSVDTARRMSALFPDSVMTGRVLMLMAQAQIKLRDFDGAVLTLKSVIANYGNEADQAKTLLDQLLRKLGPRT